ncbi:MAG TPA: ABC transporter ATP-binding protein, partial [Asanoa sp.]|nr:ABC transporter ATP-binding protein [Asanoa sp.]
RHGRSQPALRGVSIDVLPGQTVTVVGESGSGKSTLLNAALGLLPPAARVTQGQVLLGGNDITGWTDKRLATLRGTFVGLIPQDPGSSLDPVKKIGHQVCDAVRIHQKVSAAQAWRIAEAKLRLAGLPEPDRLRDQYPHELSGGMRQRVLIAIALANDPAILLADEPTSALDVGVQRQILDHLEMLSDTLGLGILLVTHDIGVAADRSDRIMVLRDGSTVEDGDPGQVLGDPRSSYTRQLLAHAPTAASTRVRGAGGTRADTADGDESVIELDAVAKHYSDVRAVDGVSLRVRRGRTHAIVGESGAGKSTLGRLVAGLTAPTTGSVAVNGRPVPDAPRRASQRWFHRQLQYVFQDPSNSLDPRYSVERSINEPLRNLRVRDTARERAQRVAELLEAVGLDSSVARRRPSELSGGQRQRVAIARALAAEPEILVLDEAVSALDVSVQYQIIQLLAELQDRLGLTYLFITHDLGVVRMIGDDVTVMRHGRVVETGPVDTVFSAPREQYTVELQEAIPGRSLREVREVA